MAVANTKSTEITNANAGTRNDVHDIASRIKQCSTTIEIAAADDDTSTYRFFRAKSGWSVKSLRITNDAITGGTDFNLGLYTINDGAAVDADLYTDGLNLETACPAVPHVVATAPYLECRFGDATTATPAHINNKIWQDLGLSADPFLEYDVVLTGATVGSGAGTVTLEMHYTAGD